MRLLIRGGRVVNPKGRSGQMDILVENGRIAQMGEGIDCEGAATLDAAGLHLFPGLVDLHCHLREPGYEYKEDIDSGTRAAAKGGFTAVCCMANTRPVTDNAEEVRYILQRAREAGYCRVYPIGAVSKEMKGEALAEMGDMLSAGAVAFSDDGRPILDGNLMRQALLYAKSFGALIMAHEEDVSLVYGGVMNESYLSTRLGLRPNTRAAEETMIARDCILAQTYDVPVHICHVSTRGGVEIIRFYKEQGVRVTCETAPHYIAGCEELVEGYDTHAKVNPPLRAREDREAIRQALAQGVIDCIATDHAPHHQDEKQVEFDLAAPGISGFESAFALSYTNLVKNGYMALSQLIQRMSAMPADIVGIPGGVLQPGAVADIAAADLETPFVLSPKDWVSKGKNNPFFGQEVYGRVMWTLLEGKASYRNGEAQI
ncbi:MAG: dihydroorotase [Christensenellales bacterium]|jgi:dihydroorotase